jgi:arabinose-5-phosphate isomerase
MGCPLIAVTGDKQSPLAEAGDIHLDISVEEEACPLKLAPTSSTTATLVMGDALAMALLEARGFSEDDFAQSHPGGALGRRLLWRVEDLMHKDALIPRVTSGSPLIDSLDEMSSKGFGMLCITQKEQLLGIFTDGDLRRCVHTAVDLRTTTIDAQMTTKPRTAQAKTLAVDALNLMENHKITALAVVDKSDNLLGIIHLHDLLRAGII